MSLSTGHVYQNTKESEPELRLPLWKANVWFAVLWTIFLINIMDRTVMNGLFPALKTAFALTDTQLGMLGSATSLILSVLLLPFAVVADKWSRRKLIAIMGALWSLATYMTGLARVFRTLLLARSSVGIGEAAFAPAASSLISAWYPQGLRGTMMGILQSAVILGQAGGVFLGGFLAYRYGWQSAFGILAVPGLILAVLSWFIPDYKTREVTASQEIAKVVKPKVKDTLAYIVKTPTLLYTYLGYAGFNLAIVAFATWGSTLFVRTYDLNIERAGTLVAVSALLQSFGAPLGGRLGDLLTKHFAGGKLLAGGLAVVVFMLLISVSLQQAGNKGPLGLTFGFWTVGMFVSAAIWPNAYAVALDLVPPFFRTISFSLLSLTGNLLGATLSPVLTGMISDRMGLTSALQLVLLLGGLSTIIFFVLAGRTFKRDVERLKNLGEFKLDRS